MSERIAVLKRVLRELAALPRTPALLSDMLELETWITELGGNSRDSAHREIMKGKDKNAID